MVFHYVVMRTRFHGGHGDFFTNTAGDNDKGQIEFRLFQHVES